MADFNEPGLSSLYTDVLADLKARDIDSGTLCINDPTNIPVSMFKYDRVSDKFQEWSGTAWVDKVLSLATGGTGASTASGARTALGLGTMALQNSSAIAVTGGTLSGVPLSATDLATGLVPQARLGSGSGGAGALFLADDQTYKATVAVQPGTGFLWFTSVAPGGYLLCDGSAVSRATYSVLFGIIGTTYGVGDGSTTFNLPDLRQRFPLGKAAAGTGNALAGTGGAIDHTHTGPSHTHTIAGHTHTGPSHTHTISADGGHTHTGPSHTHSINFLSGGEDTGHTHNGTTGFPSNTVTASGAGVNPGGPLHTHDFTTGDVSNDHHHGIIGTSAAGGTGATSSDGSHSHTGATGASGTGATSSTALTTDADGTGATGSNNPPYLVVNFIVKT